MIVIVSHSAFPAYSQIAIMSICISPLFVPEDLVPHASPPNNTIGFTAIAQLHHLIVRLAQYLHVLLTLSTDFDKL